MTSFSNPAEVATYAERVARHVPGLSDLHRMVCLLLAERVPPDGHVLVLGAGGGLELKAMAEMEEGWHLDGVDPSSQMLDLAVRTVGDFASRIGIYEGYIEVAPDGPYHGATCLLTLHFLPLEERVRTLRKIHRRLVPGGRLIVVHHSFPTSESEKDKWLARNATFVSHGGSNPHDMARNIQMMKEKLPVLSPEQDIIALQRAGFGKIELFYAALTFKGWICEKPW